MFLLSVQQLHTFHSQVTFSWRLEEHLLESPRLTSSGVAQEKRFLCGSNLGKLLLACPGAGPLWLAAPTQVSGLERSPRGLWNVHSFWADWCANTKSVCYRGLEILYIESSHCRGIFTSCHRESGCYYPSCRKHKIWGNEENNALKNFGDSLIQERIKWLCLPRREAEQGKAPQPP